MMARRTGSIKQGVNWGKTYEEGQGSYFEFLQGTGIQNTSVRNVIAENTYKENWGDTRFIDASAEQMAEAKKVFNTTQVDLMLKDEQGKQKTALTEANKKRSSSYNMQKDKRAAAPKRSLVTDYTPTKKTTTTSTGSNLLGL